MLFRSHELILFSATYLITGRFNPQKEFERHSGTQIGSAETWNAYRNAYKQLMEASGPQSGTVSILKLAEDYDKRASVEIDPAGLAWAEIPGGSGTRRIGLDVGNVLSADSDRELAFRMLMAKAGTELRSSGSRRESISEFAQDWKLLEESHADNSEHSASAARSAVSGESNEP
jgi:hypothetical protein